MVGVAGDLQEVVTVSEMTDGLLNLRNEIPPGFGAEVEIE